MNYWVKYLMNIALYRVENLDRYDDRLQVTTNLIEAYDLLMEFVAKHTSDKFCLINNIRDELSSFLSLRYITRFLGGLTLQTIFH